MDQIQQPAEAFVKRFRIQGVHAEFIELRHKRLDIFQLIQRISVFPGRLPVQGAVALIDLLHRGLLQGTVGEGLLAVGYGVMDEHRVASDGIFPLFIAKLLKGGEEGVPHFPVRKADAHVHGKGIRGGKFPQPEAGQPPVKALSFHQDTPVFPEDKAHGQPFGVPGAGIKRPGKAFGADILLIGIVDSHLRSGSDAVLALPQLDHPAFSRVGKAHGLTVHDHVEQGGAFIIKPAVAHFPLPAVHERIEDIPFSVVGKACVPDIPVQRFLFGGRIRRRPEPARAYFQHEEKNKKSDKEDSGDGGQNDSGRRHDFHSFLPVGRILLM